MSWFLTISVVLLIVYIVVVATAFADFYHKSELCFANPSPWCWTDWECPDGTKPVEDLNSTIDNCSSDKFQGTVSKGKAPPNCGCPWQSTVYDPSNWKGGMNMCLTSGTS